MSRAWRVRSGSRPHRGQWGLYRLGFFKAAVPSGPDGRRTCHGLLSVARGKVIASGFSDAKYAPEHAFGNSIHLGVDGRCWLSQAHDAEDSDDSAWIGVIFPSAVEIGCVRLYQGLSMTNEIELQRELENGVWETVSTWMPSGGGDFTSYTWLTLPVPGGYPLQAFRECPIEMHPVEAWVGSRACCVWPQLEWKNISRGDSSSHGYSKFQSGLVSQGSLGLSFFSSEPLAPCSAGATVYPGRQCSVWSSRCKAPATMTCKDFGMKQKKGVISFSVGEQPSPSCMCQETLQIQRGATPILGNMFAQCSGIEPRNDPWLNIPTPHEMKLASTSKEDVDRERSSNGLSFVVIAIVLSALAAICVAGAACLLWRRRYRRFEDAQMPRETVEVAGNSHAQAITNDSFVLGTVLADVGAMLVGQPVECTEERVVTTNPAAKYM